MTVVATEVLEPGQRSLRELADEANREHALAMQAGVSMVDHAICCGEALLAMEARYIEEAAQDDGMPPWLELLERNFDGGRTRAHNYMRVARYKDVVREHGFESINSARLHLVEIGATTSTGRKPPPDWLLKEMKRLRAEGWTIKAIAERIGKNRGYVQFWCSDPEVRERRRRKALEHWRAKQAAAKALEAQEQERAIRRAVKKAGAATAEAWAMAERMQDVLAQAQRETEDREAREALSKAGVHYRKMRDEIVRALGVS